MRSMAIPSGERDKAYGARDPLQTRIALSSYFTAAVNSDDSTISDINRNRKNSFDFSSIAYAYGLLFLVLK